MLPEAGHNIWVLWLNALILVNAHGTPVKRVWFTGCLLWQILIATRCSQSAIFNFAQLLYVLDSSLQKSTFDKRFVESKHLSDMRTVRCWRIKPAAGQHCSNTVFVLL